MLFPKPSRNNIDWHLNCSPKVIAQCRFTVFILKESLVFVGSMELLELIFFKTVQLTGHDFLVASDDMVRAEIHRRAFKKKLPLTEDLLQGGTQHSLCAHVFGIAHGMAE